MGIPRQLVIVHSLRSLPWVRNIDQKLSPANRTRNNKASVSANKSSKSNTQQSLSAKPKQKPVVKSQIKTKPNRAMLRSGGIPQGQAIKGLKMPKSKGADQIQSRLKKKSPWYQSILDPLHGADCKIPDATGVETGTLQLVQRVPLTTNTGGVAGIRILTPYAFTGPGYNTEQLKLTAAATSIDWDPLNTTTFETNAVLGSYARGHRVVSAAIYVQSEASLSDNSGLFTGFVEPFPTASTPSGLNVSVYQNNYKSALIPINNNKPIEVRWFPITMNDELYSMFYLVDANVPKWEMAVIITGAPAGVTFEATIVVNYEFLPEFNAINILDAKPSPMDAMENDLVENWVQDMEPAVITSTAKVSSSPSTVQPSHDDDQTGFGMFFNVITELAPLALALL